MNELLKQLNERKEELAKQMGEMMALLNNLQLVVDLNECKARLSEVERMIEMLEIQADQEAQDE